MDGSTSAPLPGPHAGPTGWARTLPTAFEPARAHRPRDMASAQANPGPRLSQIPGRPLHPVQDKHGLPMAPGHGPTLPVLDPDKPGPLSAPGPIASGRNVLGEGPLHRAPVEIDHTHSAEVLRAHRPDRPGAVRKHLQPPASGTQQQRPICPSLPFFSLQTALLACSDPAQRRYVTSYAAVARARRPTGHPRHQTLEPRGWAQTGCPCCSPYGDGMGFDPPEQFIKQTTFRDG